METIVIDNISKEDKKLFKALAKRLHLKARTISKEETEDIGLAYLIEEGRKSGYVDEKTIADTLSALKHK
jgi:hypothetical protein